MPVSKHTRKGRIRKHYKRPLARNVLVYGKVRHPQHTVVVVK